MTQTISIAEARKHFAEITNQVAFQGKEFLILKNGKEVAKLVAPNATTTTSPDLKAWLDDFAKTNEEDLQALASQ